MKAVAGAIMQFDQEKIVEIEQNGEISLDINGKNIKLDGSFGNQLNWCRVCDQKIFRGDILYAVKTNFVDNLQTRASLTNWPRLAEEPPGHLSLCDRDDSVQGY
jgi:hypothetical protein